MLLARDRDPREEALDSGLLVRGQLFGQPLELLDEGPERLLGLIDERSRRSQQDAPAVRGVAEPIEMSRVLQPPHHRRDAG
jgi:hypothetical protein